MTEKVLSVVIPAYNESRFIGALLEKINTVDMSPAGCRLEVIVIDDGSTDNTADIARGFGLPADAGGTATARCRCRVRQPLSRPEGPVWAGCLAGQPSPRAVLACLPGRQEHQFCRVCLHRPLPDRHGDRAEAVPARLPHREGSEHAHLSPVQYLTQVEQSVAIVYINQVKAEISSGRYM